MKEKEDPKRPIDKLRDGAGSFDLSTSDNDSEIPEMITVDGRLLVVKGKGVYEIKLADQIDPDRTNIGTPNTIQRILPFGSTHPWVGAVILTAHKLLKSNYLPKEIDCDRAMAVVLDIAEDISAIHELVEKYLEEQKTAAGSLDPEIRKDRSIILPTLGTVEVRSNEFLQKSDHALRKLFKLVKMFYSDVGPGGWESFKNKIEQGPNDIDNFSKFLSNSLPLLQLVRNARNCVEHPRKEQRLKVSDFSVDASNNLLPPMIEVIHPKTPMKKVPVADFIVQVTQNLVGIIELMLVFLCDRHVVSQAGFPVQVVEIPSDLRRSENVRYGYGLANGDQIIPMS